jgi:hypothetical protein
MANYLLTYHGEGGMPGTDEERAAVMAKWTAWFGQLGDAVVDGGNPTTRAKAISPDGSVMDATTSPTGYSIIRADSLDQAVERARGCPVLEVGQVVLVTETIDAM